MFEHDGGDQCHPGGPVSSLYIGTTEAYDIFGSITAFYYNHITAIKCSKNRTLFIKITT